MKIQTFTQTRAAFAETLDSVIDDREEVVITRKGHESVVLVPLSEYESMKETEYLLRSPENARRLLRAIEDMDNGGGVEHALIEVE